ncbi:PRC-barrel domain-containing protein [Paractinoplanes globisporus]|uniref:PRC-barrel domain-containing protein n=1 Tax=Paractinoplanes globisporus TaxID=113565 RepID=A0ABW6W8C8_9ACTN|nr:PRC-barrel domain-containing protein [Actinoplanes globisporus]
MIARSDLEYLNGADVYSPSGSKIGSAGQVHFDDRTGEPEWVSVRTGLFGRKEFLVPLGEATLVDERIEVPFDKDRVKGAPPIDADRDLSPADEEELYTYYGLSHGAGRLGRAPITGDAVTGEVRTQPINYHVDGGTANGKHRSS